MDKLVTVFTSVFPPECYIHQGRILAEGIDCYIFDHEIIWINPFKSQAVGGVKLKIRESDVIKYIEILKNINNDLLIDEEGVYSLSETFNEQLKDSINILSIRSTLRQHPEYFEDKEKLNELDLGVTFDDELLNTVFESEHKHFQLNKKRWKFNWDQFIQSLFAPEIDFFKYLRPKGNEFYLEEAEVEMFEQSNKSTKQINCPFCESKNTVYGPKIKPHWNIPYLIISLALAPMPFISHAYYCFDCKRQFKKKSINDS